MWQDLLIMALVAVPLVLYYQEKIKRMKAETDLQVVLKRRKLDEIGKDLDDSRPAYDASLRELGTGSSNEDDLSRREMQEAAPTSGPPKYFKGIAVEDLREGQEVEITVDTTSGTTRVTSKRATPPFTAPVGPSEQ